MLRKSVASEQVASEHPRDSDPLPAEPEFSELESQGSQITQSQSQTGVLVESLLEVAVYKSRTLTSEEIFSLLTTKSYDSGDMSLCYSDSDTTKRRKLSFQNKWLDRHTWLHYGSCRGNRGGWCIPCILFVSEVEKTALGQFVTSPSTSYYKSKEMFNKHSSKNLWRGHMLFSSVMQILHKELM